MDGLIRYLKNAVGSWFKRWLTTLPLAGLGIALFFIALTIGGAGDAVCAFALLFFMVDFLKVSIPRKSYFRHCLVLFIAAMLGTIASTGYILNILINFTVMFIFVFMSSDDYLPRSHFILGGMLILAQMSPYPPARMPLRMLSLAVCLAVVSVFLLIIKRIVKFPSSQRFAAYSFEKISEELLELGNGSDSLSNHDEIMRYATVFSKEIYPSVHMQSGIMRAGQRRMLRILLCMEQIEQLVNEAGFYKADFQAEETDYFKKLSALFKKAGEHGACSGFLTLSQELDAFLRENHLEHAHLKEDWNSTLHRLADELQYHKEYSKEEAHSSFGLDLRWHQLRSDLNWHSLRFRFALKVAVVNGIGFSISYRLPFLRSFWLPMVIYLIVSQFHQNERKNAISRLSGTAVGALVFLATTEFIPGNIRFLVVLCVSVTLILSASTTFFMMIVATQIALSGLEQVNVGLEQAILFRLFIVIGAALLVWLVGSWLLRTEKHHALYYKARDLIAKYEDVASTAEDWFRKKENNAYFNELMLSIQLATDNIEQLAREQSVFDQKYLSTVIIPSCTAFRLEMIHVFVLCKDYILSDEQTAYFLNEVLTLKDTLQAAESLEDIEALPFNKETISILHPYRHMQKAVYHVSQIAHGFTVLKNEFKQKQTRAGDRRFMP